MSTITAVEPIILKIPFSDGSAGTGLFPSAWTELEIVLVRVETDDALIGWGEGFGYHCSEAVAAMVRSSVAPILVGQPADDPAMLGEMAQRKMVLPGRYGISVFALSGADIALWDLAGKRAGVPLADLIGGRTHASLRAYASLVRYGRADLVKSFCVKARDEGFDTIKLHEITTPEIRSAGECLGDGTRIVVDVNCNWTEAFTREVIPELQELGCLWLEEPIFPPEDFRTLASLRETGMPLASGENACTAVQFEQMLRERAVDHIQPSITKVGGVSEFLKIRTLASSADSTDFMLHSPYFGPGYLASLQLASLADVGGLFEYLYVEPETWIYRDMPLPEAGSVPVPDGPGLGMDPDPEILAAYAWGRTGRK